MSSCIDRNYYSYIVFAGTLLCVVGFVLTIILSSLDKYGVHKLGEGSDMLDQSPRMVSGYCISKVRKMGVDSLYRAICFDALEYQGFYLGLHKGFVSEKVFGLSFGQS